MLFRSRYRCMNGDGLSPQVKALLSEGLNRPRKGSDAGDHPPITPMRAASESELGGRLYMDIEMRYYACVMLVLTDLFSYLDTAFKANADKLPLPAGSDVWCLFEYITNAEGFVSPCRK